MDIKDVVEDVKRSISESKEFGEQYVVSPGKKGVNFDENNFFGIAEKEMNVKACFVDGGNSEIICSSNMSLHLVRVCGVVFEGNQRKDIVKREFFVLVKSEVVEGKIFYKAQCYGEGFTQEFVFDAYEKSLRQGNFRVEISRIGECVRGYIEIDFMKKMIDEVEGIRFLIRDGLLSAEIVDEDRYFEALFEKAKEKKVAIVGLAKTNSLLTNGGEPAGYVLNRKCKLPSWYYFPVFENEKKFLAKLHEKSGYVMQVEIAGVKDGNSVNEVFSYLCFNSKDGVFLGYPYGLIAADKFARVSNDERDYYKTKLMVSLGKEWKDVKEMMSSKDAHGILDNIG